MAFSSARRWSAVAFGPEVGAATGTWLLGAPEMLASGDASKLDRSLLAQF